MNTVTSSLMVIPVEAVRVIGKKEEASSGRRWHFAVRIEPREPVKCRQLLYL
jgi:hypothetical protein